MYSVYIITNKAQAKDDLYKLGKHKGTKKKLISRYQTTLPMPEVIKFQSSDDYSTDESNLHKLLKKYKYAGEWYEIKREKIVEIFDTYFGIESSDSDSDSDSDSNSKSKSLPPSVLKKIHHQE